MVGRTDLLQRSSRIDEQSKAATLDIEKLLDSDDGPNSKEINQNHHLDIGFDLNYLYKDAKQSIEDGKLFKGNYVINNEQRDVVLSQEVTLLSVTVLKGYQRGQL